VQKRESTHLDSSGNEARYLFAKYTPNYPLYFGSNSNICLIRSYYDPIIALNRVINK